MVTSILTGPFSTARAKATNGILFKSALQRPLTHTSFHVIHINHILIPQARFSLGAFPYFQPSPAHEDKCGFN